MIFKINKLQLLDTDTSLRSLKDKIDDQLLYVRVIYVIITVKAAKIS